VTMACHKFLQRIVAPDLHVEQIELAQNNAEEFASHLHAYTIGINSDPVTKCAIIFSALIHDADRKGVSNMQLGKEEQAMADSYRHKSGAGTKESTLHSILQLFLTCWNPIEQNLLDLCWSMPTLPEYNAFGQTKPTFALPTSLRQRCSW
jgi:hypothetical protein